MLNVPEINWTVLGPQLLVLATGVVVLIADLAVSRRKGGALGNLPAALGLAGVLFVLVFQFQFWGKGPLTTMAGMVVLDDFALFFNLILLAAAAISILVAWNYLRVEQIQSGEYYVLLLFAVFGMMVMAATTSLLMIFLGLEIMSVAVYVMAGLLTRQAKSNESALKYFLLGAFSTGFLLYGIAGLYLATGSLDVAEIAKAPLRGNLFAVVGMGLLLVGFGFKIASVPFHMWTPDVYEGAPTSVTGFMAVAVKAAAFAAFLRVFVLGFGQLKWEWVFVVYWLAVLTMTYGNVVALVQKNIKRMLAYSSIAHAGYLLVAMAAIGRTPAQGAGAVMYYLLVYTFMNLGAFAVVAYLAKKDEQQYDIEGYGGLAYRHPLAALALAVFLFSLAGIPPFAGFIGKFYIFSAAISAHMYYLAIIGVLNSALSVYYYIRVVYLMYAKEPVADGPMAGFSAAGGAAILVSAVAVVALGIFPSRLLDLAGQAVGMLLK